MNEDEQRTFEAYLNKTCSPVHTHDTDKGESMETVNLRRSLLNRSIVPSRGDCDIPTTTTGQAKKRRKKRKPKKNRQNEIEDAPNFEDVMQRSSAT